MRLLRQKSKRDREQQAPRCTPAKITYPVCSGVYERHRVFQLLDQARSRPIVWVSSPAGAGKTTLLASYMQARAVPCLWYRLDAGDRDIASFFYYLGRAGAHAECASLPLLTPDYLPGLEAFAANFFRDLFARFSPPAMLVLDNFQDLVADEKIHRVMQAAFAQIPAGVNVIVLSREQPPGAFARERASERMNFLSWDDIQLTAEECSAIAVAKIGKGAYSADIAAKLHEQTQGWVAGLVLLTEQLHAPSRDAVRPGGAANQCIFDYFAHEVFRDSDPAVQEFLLQTAFLTRFSAAIAQALTGSDRAREILNDFARRNLFTTCQFDGSYEYHALFRTFLSSKAKEVFTAERIAALRQSSAGLLAANGELDPAIDLLRELGNWSSLTELIRMHAPTLVAQGRTQTVASWLAMIPATVREQDPWLLYWLGVCQLYGAPIRARGNFQQAYELFSLQGDTVSLHLAWSKIIESYVLDRSDSEPMGAWLDKYKELSCRTETANADVEADSVFAYVAGLTHHRFDDPQLEIYVGRAERLLERQSDADKQLGWSVNLIPYYLWKGHYGRMRRLLQNLAGYASAPEAKPLAKLHWYLWKGMAAGIEGAAAESLHLIENGLTLARDSGVHVLDLSLFGYGIWGQLCVGDVAKARELLDRMEKLPRIGPRRELPFRHYNAMVLLHERQYAAAIAENLHAVQLAKSVGMLSAVVSYSLNLAFSYVAQGDLTAASATLDDIRAKAYAMQSKPFISYCLLCEADICRLRGDTARALGLLRDALAMREELGSVTPPFMQRDNAANLYSMALDADIRSEYVRNTIAKTRLLPPIDNVCERWPWSLRLYALGQFAVHMNGVPLVSNARQKPMQLLRALVVNGGRDVSVTALAQAIWPDTDGDMAKRAVETALHRLRRMIGETAILRHGNRLSLNPQECWLDIWAFDELVDNASQMSCASLLAIYKGALLAAEDFDWAIQERTKYQSKFARAIVGYAEELERRGEWQEAAALYRRALEVEPVAEEIYRHLMRCYQQLDCANDALLVYQRCQRVLASTLKSKPSSAMLALRAEIESARLQF